MATKLRALGFCGVDNSVSPELLAAISSRYEYVEWGILLRDELETTPRYASKSWMERLKLVNASRRMRLAGHLCSTRCAEVLKGDGSYVLSLHEEIGLNRFQVNATAANNVTRSLVNEEGARNLKNVILSLPQVEFIIQRNEETKPIWEYLDANELPSNVSYLFDESKGTGVVAAEWPNPPSNVPFGYAGGLGPKTLEEQLTKMLTKTDSLGGENPVEIWVDMESSLRTVLKDDTDIFDVNKAMECIFIVMAFAADGRMAAPGL